MDTIDIIDTSANNEILDIFNTFKAIDTIGINNINDNIDTFHTIDKLTLLPLWTMLTLFTL